MTIPHSHQHFGNNPVSCWTCPFFPEEIRCLDPQQQVWASKAGVWEPSASHSRGWLVLARVLAWNSTGVDEEWFKFKSIVLGLLNGFRPVTRICFIPGLKWSSFGRHVDH